MTSSGRVLLVVGTDTSRDRSLGPRRDYAVLAERLGATILDRADVRRSIFGRVLGGFGAEPVAHAWAAFQLRRNFDLVLTDGEHVGIPLALLLRVSRSRIKHITIGHRLSAAKKRPFFRLLRVHERIDRILLHSRRQREFATDELGIEHGRTALVPYQVDTSFWRPAQSKVEDLVVSVGLEFRDYDTLMAAVDGTRARVIVAAASPWSRHSSRTARTPANVELKSLGYPELRDLYARAAIVVVPLLDVDNQAGVTTILEAMAMGKAVVVTQSVGQTDVVEDRRSASRGIPRPRATGIVAALAHETGTALEPNGFYVPPGDPAALRRAIVYLLDHPEERVRLGAAGRRTAERFLSVDHFADRVTQIVAGCLGPTFRVHETRRWTAS